MMSKLLLILVVVFAVLCANQEVAAQSDIALATRQAKLKDLSEKLKKRDENNRRGAREYAQRKGIAMRRELPNGRVLELQRIAPGIGPIFYVTYNVDAADTISTDEVWPGGSTGLNLDGAGMVVAEWDGGAIYAAHPDFTGRLTQVDGATSVSNHSTHVAGTLIGAGDWLVAEARGMAYAAHLDAYDWNFDTSEMALAASNGQLWSNHSYGIAAGWLYIGDIPPNTWWWIGGEDPLDVEDPNFGYYDSETQLWDQIAFDAPYYLIVKAAGNDRSDIGPSPGEEYTVIDQAGTPLFTSTLARNSDCAPGGYDCLPTVSVAKNILTVGAADDLIGGYSDFSGPSSVQMAEFSGWGPTDDGRIKPDLVGNGMFLMSTYADYPHYAAAAGTSMSAPNVTGSLVLLQEHYEDTYGANNFMRASTLKALAIHTADEAGDADGPDYAFGWGLMNTKSAAEVISDSGTNHQIIEGSLANGGTNSLEIIVTEADVLITATLVWTDPPGDPVAPGLDSTDIMLVNDLDLRIQNGPTTHLPWVLNPESPASAASKGNNIRDNVEQVVIEGGGAGSYFVEVSHKGTLLNNENQNYSVIVSVKPTPPVGSILYIDENFSGGLPAGWSIDTVSGIPWTINSPVPGDSRLNNLTGGGGNFAMVDNDYSNISKTSLRPPVFDMSDAQAAVLRFKSYFSLDFLESINVDVSTDGGTGWVNVWQYQGFNPYPTNYVLDLTSAAAGHASFMLRFRFDSHGDKQGNLWQIDDVELEVFGGGPPPGDPPGQASNPNPLNGDSGLDYDADLSWSAGSLAISHDVYFGTNPAPGFQGNQAGTSFGPGTLAYSTTYYWRIDEVNGSGTTTGDTWSFNTEVALVLPGPASNSSPGDGAGNVGIDSDLNWSAGSGATSHDVYFGPASPPASQGNQTGTNFDPDTLGYDATYFWRIDEVNDDGTTTGTEWSFTTESAPQQNSEIHLNKLSASSIPGSRNRWSASVQIDVMDDSGQPAMNVFAEGGWSNGSNGGASCTTNGSGRCSVQKSNLKGNVSSVVFTVNNLSGSGMDYVPAANETGTAITANQDGSSSNQVPNAVNDNYSTTVDTPTSGNVLSNDDPGDAPATVSSHDGTSALGVSITIGSNGSLTYAPPPGVDGTDTFGYTITDNNGDSNSATVTVVINSAPSNQLPNAVDDSFSTNQDQAFNDNVMSNDDPGDAPATASASSASAEGGSVSMSGNGDFTYAPPGGFSGPDSFSYTITDNNGDSDPATVSITVNPVSGGGMTLSVSKSRSKGNWAADLSWSGGSGTGQVTITRNESAVNGSPTANDGAFSVSHGKKPSGTFDYEVCENDSSQCASDSVQF